MFFRLTIVSILLALAGCTSDISLVPDLTRVKLTAADHTYFPINTGSVHAALTCNDCHGAFATFKEYSCIGCHNHEEVLTTAGHIGVQNFTYASAACLTCHPTGSRLSTVACGGCHGDANGVAPPIDRSGNTATTFTSIGAHQIHLGVGAKISLGVQCRDCHLVPAATADPGHLDPVGTLPTDPDYPAEIAWGSMASHGSVSPNWDHASATCTDTYCHGNFPGGTTTSPLWAGTSTVLGQQAACGSCHGIPPASPHPPAGQDCSACHSDSAGTNASNATITNKALHINGIVESNGACNSCHGDSTKISATLSSPVNAPPKDSLGNMATTARGVGAHNTHMNGGLISAGMKCNECHVVPSSSGDCGHTVGAGVLPLCSTDSTKDVAEVVFGTVSTAGGAVTPSINTSNANAITCSNTYCHGNFRGGTSSTPPNWQNVGPTEPAIPCGSACHLNPPPLPFHPQRTDCSTCHGMVVDAANNFVDKSLHVNGWVDISNMSCNSCHGNGVTANANDPKGSPSQAPPNDTSGKTLTTDRGVGAHQIHLDKNITVISNGVLCKECHTVPISIDAPGHRDHLLPATVKFGTMSRIGGTVPSPYDATLPVTSLTCANTYCHGSFNGGNPTLPLWTTVDMVNHTQAKCGSCHGAAPGDVMPPTPPHPVLVVGNLCQSCHSDATGTVTAPGGVLKVLNGAITNKALHINGVVEGGGACNSCHGDRLTANATNPGGSYSQAPLGAVGAVPYYDTLGNTASTARGVGVHQRHLGVNSKISNGVPCTECHLVPAAMSDKGHTTDPLSGGTDTTPNQAEVAWGPLAKKVISPAPTPIPTVVPYNATLAVTALTCQNTYCHGAFPGGLNAAPLWIGGTAACGSCHALPVASGEHNRGDHKKDRNTGKIIPCIACHPTGYDGAGKTITGDALITHGDGNRNVCVGVVTASCQIKTWSAGTRSCTPTCHGSENWSAF